MGVEGGTADGTTLEAVEEKLDGEIIPVDQLNEKLGAALEDVAPHFDYVLGDVSDVYESSADHLHFDLVRDDSTVHIVVFSYRRDSLSDDIDEDTHVAVKGDLSFHEAEGSVSVLASDVVVVGEGDYQAIYQENRDTLAEDGLLDDDAKQSLPPLPSRVGLATSAKSDAREDAITSLHAQHPGIDVVVQDTRVQGDGAVGSLMEAISTLDRDEKVDLIVVTRGGGADKHLRVFNELALCRVVANADTPVVAAIGHENDEVLAGEVADQRVMTPTDVGTVVRYPYDDVREELVNASDRLETAYQRHAVETIAGTAEELEAAYTDRVSSLLASTETQLDHAMETLVSERLTDLDNKLDHAYESLQQSKEHEEEKEEAVEEAREEAKDEVEEEVRTEYEQKQRRQRIAIAVLIVLLLALLAYLFL